MNIWGYCLQKAGWTVEITAPRRNKCVICVAPHTSNWDFPLGLAAYKSLGRNANFLMKKFWFFWPMKYLMTSLGGIPVVRGKNSGGLTEAIVEMFRNRDYMNLAVTPEGTRSLQKDWHTGFLRIAREACVPIQLGVIDYSNKKIIICKEFVPSGNIEFDMSAIKAYYAQFPDAAKYPAKFTSI